MSRLTQDGTAEPVSRDQILRHARGQGNIIFPVQLTTSRIGNLTRLIHTLLYVCDDHTYIHTSYMHTYSIYKYVPRWSFTFRVFPATVHDCCCCCCLHIKNRNTTQQTIVWMYGSTRYGCQSCSWSAEQRIMLFFSCPRSSLRIWSRDTGSAVPSRISLVIFHTQAESGAY